MSIIWCISITSNVKSWKQIRRNSSTSLLHSSSGKELSHGSTHIWRSDNFEAIGAAHSSFWPLLPKFWGVMSKMTTLQNLGVPDRTKVRRSRFVAQCYRDLKHPTFLWDLRKDILVHSIDCNIDYKILKNSDIDIIVILILILILIL